MFPLQIRTRARSYMHYIQRRLKRIYHTYKTDFSVFTSADAVSINLARMEHLSSLNLNLAGKKILEVGAGIGLLGEFFEKHGCDLTATDSRPENIAELKKRYPHRKAFVLDLEKDIDPRQVGMFDVVFCYGLLYHLSDPEKALRSLSNVCRDMILLETCVTPGNNSAVNVTGERGDVVNQASSHYGCRPTRPFIMDCLRRYYGHAYITKSQPRHPDFDTDWTKTLPNKLHRSVFIGSTNIISNQLLTETIPDKQSSI